MKFLVRWINRLKDYLTLILVVVILYEMKKGNTTLFNWVFFSLNLLNLCFFSNNDGKTTTLKHSRRIAACLIYFSIFTLLTECLFTWKFGMKENKLVESND